ncbi:pseudaminic acid synthase [Salidesulfovibrio brasiliensis]|uniref:pseudaminic acid synthase n=1 Tax=Salidesulfovibrio brasiliensis TaxID=221711 RepID=UPI0006D1F314|nr:pseudaminic acid synthase [Salidesulfovibrio brasiliensis]
MKPSIRIGNHTIGGEHPTYIIAELSANHNQSFDRAVELVRLAKEAGADAVKLQTYTPDTMTLDCDTDIFKVSGGTVWDGKNLHALYGEAYTPWEWQPKLKAIADELEMDCFSSPFDSTAVDFLEEMAVPAYKVASFEVVDLPLLKRIGATGKPVIMSTGMATLAEIDEAMTTLKAAGSTQIALLKCVSSYPAPPEEMNLRTIPNLSETFSCPVGLSDHSMVEAVPVSAVALGASIVEKHMTIARADGGPDSAFSLEPDEFKAMVAAVRTSEKALGDVSYDITKRQVNSLRFRRSIFVSNDMKAGDVFSEKNTKVLRPADGLHPRYHTVVLGKKAARDIVKGTPLSWDLIG